MAESRYSQFKKYILFHEEFVFIISLYQILNEKYEVKTNNGQLKFIMSYLLLKKIKKSSR